MALTGDRLFIPSLDGIRAVSIGLVFVGHAGFGHIVPGGFGVTIFFFLSGYLITTLLCREWDQHGRIALGAFYLRRVIRLAPALLITLAAACALNFAGLVGGTIDTATVLSQLLFFWNYYSLYIDGSQAIDGLGILWSLSVEEHFYLIWPALFILFGRKSIGLVHIVWLIAAILVWRFVRHFGFGDSEWVIYILTDTRFDSLLFGCLLALLQQGTTAERLFPRKWQLLYIVAAVLVLLLSFVIRDGAFRSTLRYSVQGLALMPLFHYAVTRGSAPGFNLLNLKFVRRIGQWSYTMYLCHFVIIHALVFNGVAQFGDLSLVLWAGVLTLAFSSAVYYLVEKPLQPLRRKLTGHQEIRG